jgi:hypothetical protein
VLKFKDWERRYERSARKRRWAEDQLRLHKETNAHLQFSSPDYVEGLNTGEKKC